MSFNGRTSIAGIFFGEEEIWPYETEFENLHIIPASSDQLQQVEQTTRDDVPEKVNQNFLAFLNETDVREDYDFIIIDTPPSKGPLTRSAIKVANNLIIPTQLERFSVEGIYGMLQLYRQESYIRAADNPINLIGIVPNQFRDISLHKDYFEELKKVKSVKQYVLPYFIKKRTAYSEVLQQDAKPKSIFHLRQKKIERQEMEKICSHCVTQAIKKSKHLKKIANIITCPTNKGGEGKTTLCIHLAEYIAIVLNKKVLAIDLDPQANLSSRYLNMEMDPVAKDCRMPPVHPYYEEYLEECSEEEYV